MSDPFKPECMSEQARKAEEMRGKSAGPSTLNLKPMEMKPLPVKPKQATTNNSGVAVSSPVQDTDWRRPRLPQPLAADWPRWNFAPSDSILIVGMKLKPLLQSSVLQKLLGAEVMQQLQDTKPPVDEVWLSLSPAAAGNQPVPLVLMIGPGVGSIAEEIRSKGASVCFLDHQSLLAGEWNDVNDALQQVAAGQPNRFSKRAGELWSKNDLWILAGKQLAAAMAPRNGAKSEISGVSMGVSFRDNFVVDMVLTAATPAVATKLVAEYQAKPDELGLGPVKVERTGSEVSVHAEVNLDQMPEQLRRQMASYVGPIMQMTAPKNKPAKAVISGLDNQ